MAVLKVLFTCDVCGRGTDASKIACVHTTDSKGVFVDKVDMCSECRGVFLELLNEVIKIQHIKKKS